MKRMKGPDVWEVHTWNCQSLALFVLNRLRHLLGHVDPTTAAMREIAILGLAVSFPRDRKLQKTLETAICARMPRDLGFSWEGLNNFRVVVEREVLEHLAAQMPFQLSVLHWNGQDDTGYLGEERWWPARLLNLGKGVQATVMLNFAETRGDVAWVNEAPQWVMFDPRSWNANAPRCVVLFNASEGIVDQSGSALNLSFGGPSVQHLMLPDRREIPGARIVRRHVTEVVRVRLNQVPAQSQVGDWVLRFGDSEAIRLRPVPFDPKDALGPNIGPIVF